MEHTSSKKTIGIIVILVIIIVGILLMMKKSAPITVPTSTANTPSTSQPAPAPVVDTSPAGLIKSSGTATASLEQDSASVDAALKGLSTDTTSANQAVQ
ncbi:MAG: hypothetical protein WCG55_03635 [bacterium]